MATQQALGPGQVEDSLLAVAAGADHGLEHQRQAFALGAGFGGLGG